MSGGSTAISPRRARCRRSAIAAIVGVHGVTEAYGSGYVGMTYEQGRDFKIWLHELRRVPTQEELDKLVVPLLDALAQLHGAGLQHHDLAPENVLVRDDGTPVLIDFGAARTALRLKVDAGSGSRHPYAAPEQMMAEGGETGPATDIYALAGLLYLAVTGKAPPVASARMLRDDMAPASVATEGRYRNEFLAAIDAGLRFRPSDRPQSVAAWREQLMRTNVIRSLIAKPQAAAEEAARRRPLPRRRLSCSARRQQATADEAGRGRGQARGV